MVKMMFAPMQTKIPATHRASDLLAASPLATQLERIQTHKAILSRVKEWLPQSLAEHCRDCVVGGNQRLILYTDGPAWTFQLRFHAPSLLERFSELSALGFRAIEIRNLPAAEPKRPRPAQPPATSPDVVRLIMDCSRETSSAELSKALSRLATTLESGCGRDDNGDGNTGNSGN